MKLKKEISFLRFHLFIYLFFLIIVCSCFPYFWWQIQSWAWTVPMLHKSAPCCSIFFALPSALKYSRGILLDSSQTTSWSQGTYLARFSFFLSIKILVSYLHFVFGMNVMQASSKLSSHRIKLTSFMFIVLNFECWISSES